VEISGGEERAAAVLRRIAENADVLVGNRGGLQKGLGIPGPEVAAKSQARPSAFLAMIGEVTHPLPQVQGGGHHAARGALDEPPRLERRRLVEGSTFVAPTAELDVLDRVGGGDGFASASSTAAERRGGPRPPSGWAGRTARC